jgi:flagellar basal body-associated protein FliL
MRVRSLCVLVIVALVVHLAGNMAYATFIGSGQTASSSWDGWDPAWGAPGDLRNVITMDTGGAKTLAAGVYQAASFDYEFRNATNTKGTITPFLATKSGAVYTPIAVGDTVTNIAASAFASHSFGTNNSFTLTAESQVYAGFWWDNSAATSYGTCPIGFVWGSGGGGSAAQGGFATLTAPVVGTAIPELTDVFTGGEGRAYCFGVTTTSVPEPSVASLLGIGLSGLLAYAWRRGRRSPRAG